MIGRVLISVVLIAAGYGLRIALRPSAGDLQTRAVEAWNSGKLSQAEQLARKALARAEDAPDALNVLDQVAAATNRPLLAIAAAKTRLSNSSLNETSRLLQLGDIAMQHAMLRVAETFWQQALDAAPDSQLLRQRIVTLAGLRMDADSMLQLLSEDDNPDPQLVLLCLGAFSVDPHDALPAEPTLRQAVLADPADRKTRHGLARCLIAMGQHRECLSVLPPDTHDAVGTSLRAVALALDGQHSEAENCLAQAAIQPSDMTADAHFARAMIATAQQRISMAVSEMQRAVDMRPLSTVFRSRLCDLLRHGGQEDQMQSETQHLKTVLKFTEICKDNNTRPDKESFLRLLPLCRQLNATRETALVRKTLHTLEAGR